MLSFEKYCKFYLIGYLNNYRVSQSFGGSLNNESFQEKKVKFTLDYLGIRIRDIGLIIKLIPLINYFELLFAFLIVSIRLPYVFIKRIFSARTEYCGMLFNPSLTYSSFRVKKYLEPIHPENIHTLKIPFIKHNYVENDISILTGVSYKDILYSYLYSLKIISYMFIKYRKRDCFFRSFSSFEYLLTCCFVKNTDADNRFVYFNTFDRWAILFCNCKHSIFIQHGSLTDDRLIKIGTPHIAYYISKGQKSILERNLFREYPSIVRYRPTLELTEIKDNLNNGKKNVLLVCCNQRIKEEWLIVKQISSLVNLYIKPHPADTHNSTYTKMSVEYNCVIVSKSEYPNVDLVISYESTLADEYEEVGIRVIRYEKLSNLCEIESLV